MTDSCVLCRASDEPLIWQNEQVRVIDAAETDYPCYTRVIWQQHVKEMTDLSPAEQMQLMRFVFCVESVQRQVLNPDKINLAQFGTVVPHLHWHIIPRVSQDRHFPGSTWGKPRFSSSDAPDEWHKYLNQMNRLKPAYHQALTLALATI
ncbi:HIT family protein [Advenella sp. WQ 585]|uniref:HIT family protein n=1 Tax=Advenella mandrilli TaxID=2800330 RepID=A0ABS1ED45_9BURK|nr:HIT family protein [Advenella mandrilli]MBK1781879.1 HIT family protein [Advenella mandrilli]